MPKYKVPKRKFSGRRKAVKSAVKPKRKSSVPKHTPYQQGSTQILNIQYNGIGSEFVFALTNNKGKIGSQFHIKSDLLLSAMTNPLMVNSI